MSWTLATREILAEIFQSQLIDLVTQLPFISVPYLALKISSQSSLTLYALRVYWPSGYCISPIYLIFCWWWWIRGSWLLGVDKLLASVGVSLVYLLSIRYSVAMCPPETLMHTSSKYESKKEKPMGNNCYSHVMVLPTSLLRLSAAPCLVFLCSQLFLIAWVALQLERRERTAWRHIV